jgi:siroheme synthase-like protein
VALVLAGRPVLVVGGGPVAARKVAGLRAAGAAVTVVAPDIRPEIEADPGVTVARRPYRAGDAARFRLVVTATGVPAVDRAVAAEAEAAGVWCNSADDPEACTFLLPAVHRDGAVTLAVSTAGSSPALAGWLRDRAAAALAPGTGELARLLARARADLVARGRPTSALDWAGLLAGPLPDLVAAGRTDEATRLLSAAVDRVAPP